MATWKSIIRKAFSLVLFPFAAAYTRTRPGIRILMYHRVDRFPCYDQLTVSPERFERHMAYLATHQRDISLTQALAELASTGKMRETAPGNMALRSAPTQCLPRIYPDYPTSKWGWKSARAAGWSSSTPVVQPTFFAIRP